MDSLTRDVPIELKRVRYFYDLKNPFLIKCKEEFTIFNSGLQKDEISYNLGFYKPNIAIFDTDQNKLEFYSNPADSRIVNIVFPKGRKLEKDEFRTLTLEYTLDISYRAHFRKRREWMLTIDLNKADSSYIHIHLNDYYSFKAEYLLDEDDGEQAPINLRNFLKTFAETKYKKIIMRSDSGLSFEISKLELKETPEYIDLRLKFSSDKDYKLKIIYDYDVSSRQKIWFIAGGAFGVIACISIFFLLLKGSKADSYYSIPLASAVIAYLIVTKGWLLSNSLDTAIDRIDITGSRIDSFNTLYIIILGILMIEILLVIAKILSIIN